ncbi:MAG: phenylalanine--tRNA ligase subunit alpha [Desulfovermiculus sp.]
MNKFGSDFVQCLEQLREEGLGTIHTASTPEEIEQARITYLGRKGKLARHLASLPSLPKEERPQAGEKANQIKQELTKALQEAKNQLEQKAKDQKRASFDPTLPGRRPWIGTQHPISQVLDEICQVFVSIGFDVVTGPEVETDFYNFEALNIPQDHPARDMQDTLYISDAIVLRTHTSPLQIRTMLTREPPVAAVAPGKVYRRDADLTHSPMFHQIEGFLVDSRVSMADLRGTLTYFVQHIFDPKTRVRFRPSFFPFTEPSAEVDISCVICGGSGWVQGQPCRVCKQTGWVEILGCGMIDPAVFSAVGYDPETVSGFAFGLGVERVAMLKYGIDDLRLFFDNDLRFLHQFQNPPRI